MALREYQQEVYQAVVNAMRRGFRRPLVVLPCGAGKSYLFAEMAAKTNGDVLILTHRRELLAQHESLLAELGINNARVSMILTEANHLGEYPTPKLIITDEAHLSRSNSWVKVMDFYDTHIVGFTATPVRLDGKPLGDIYDTLIQGVSVKWLIEHGNLAPFEYYAPTCVETDGLRIQAGDYVIKDLEKLMSARAIYSDVLKSWKRLAKGKKTIAYCVSVKHAKDTAQMFIKAGYPAMAIDAGTPEKQRAKIMQDFRDGKIMVLCNVGIISEGVSIDDVICCLLLRPTESHALFWQQAMRCMRYQEGKTAIIIDCVGNYTRNPLPDADVGWSLTTSPKKRKRTDENGNFYIRTCPHCFKVFKTADSCPYCGTEYPLHPRELEAHEQIELERITQEQAEQLERERKQARRQQGRAQSFEDLVKLGRERGYKNPAAWAAMVLRGRHR